MALRDEWKETGKSLGTAFGDLGKNILRSAKTTVNKVDDWATGEKKTEEEKANESTVFNDGSWRNTGKELGGAFKNLGQSLISSGKAGVDKVADKVDGVGEPKAADPDYNPEVVAEEKSEEN